MDLNGAHLFAVVVAKGSFSGAATHTGIPVATVSRKVAALEKALGLRLLERSTRNLRLTEAGQILYTYAARGVEAFEAGLAALQEQQFQLKGRLRLSMPPGFEPIWPVLDRFQVKHPDVILEIFATERRVDFIADGIDVALRLGRQETQTAMVRSLGSYRHKLVATPAFIEKHPVACPEDLAQVPCAAWSHPMKEVVWQLGSTAISIAPLLRVNEYSQLKALVLTGRYLTELPPFYVDSALQSGVLVEVLPEAPMPPQAVALMYPSRENLSQITRVFIDFVHMELSELLR